MPEAKIECKLINYEDIIPKQNNHRIQRPCRSQVVLQGQNKKERRDHDRLEAVVSVDVLELSLRGISRDRGARSQLGGGNMISPSKVDLRTLPFLPLARRSELPNCSGIYFTVTRDFIPVYIGQSESFKQRWNSHDRLKQVSKFSGAKIVWLATPLHSKASRIKLEKRFIKRFKSALNNTSNGGRPHIEVYLEDLKRINLIRVIRDYRTNADVIAAAIALLERRGK